MKRTKLIWPYLAALALAVSLESSVGYYDPAVQRWINRDPIQEEGGKNLFAFTHNAALAFIDPFGNDITVVSGSTVCDGDGGFAMQIANDRVDSICTKRHENQHINDLEHDYPKACYGPDGKPLPRGSNPRVPAKEADAFKKKTECNAWKVSLQCERELLCQPEMAELKQYLYQRLNEAAMQKRKFCDDLDIPNKWRFQPWLVKMHRVSGA
jgi:uncharacterized protein RhaS with RHS repeats